MAEGVNDEESSEAPFVAVGDVAASVLPTARIFDDALRTAGIFGNAIRMVNETAKLRTDVFNAGEFHTLANLMKNGGASSAGLSLSQELSVESDSYLVVSEWVILNWRRGLARPLVLIVGPVCAIEILFIAWSVASHKGPEARQALFDMITIISVVLAMMPIFNRISGGYDR